MCIFKHHALPPINFRLCVENEINYKNTNVCTHSKTPINVIAIIFMCGEKIQQYYFQCAVFSLWPPMAYYFIKLCDFSVFTGEF